MAAIEEHLVRNLMEDLAHVGVAGAQVSVISGDAEDWQFLIRTHGREFDTGFNHRQSLWCHEITRGGEKHLVSADAQRVATSMAARELALRLIRTAVAVPTWAPRNPPAI